EVRPPCTTGRRYSTRRLSMGRVTLTQAAIVVLLSAPGKSGRGERRKSARHRPRDHTTERGASESELPRSGLVQPCLSDPGPRHPARHSSALPDADVPLRSLIYGNPLLRIA